MRHIDKITALYPQKADWGQLLFGVLHAGVKVTARPRIRQRKQAHHALPAFHVQNILIFNVELLTVFVECHFIGGML